MRLSHDPQQEQGNDTGWPAEGRIREPFPRDTCQNADCEAHLTYEGTAAYLHSNRESGGLLVFCGACSQTVQMYDSLRFPLVAL